MSTFEYKAIKELKLHPKNPRIIRDHKFKSLVKSIKEFPEMLELRPIVVNASGVILGGNMRFKAAQEAKLTKIPVMVAKLTEAQENEFIIKDNLAFGEWDWDALANEWEQEDLVDWGIDSFNFGTKAELLEFEDEETSNEPTGNENSDEKTIAGVDKPKITDNGYVRFEVVLLENQKLEIIKVLNNIQEINQVNLGEALFILSQSYLNNNSNG